MGILNLSLVTKSLINLLTYSFSTSPENPVAKITFSSQRPDQLKGDVVGLYLYHVSEDAHYKNLPVPEDATAPVRYSSMGLSLYYQLIAQYLSKPEDPDAAIIEQNMMGIAMKALHDYPIIDELTMAPYKKDDVIEEKIIFEDSLKGTGTRLRIELLNIDQKDAMGYWATSNAAPRLAAYYKVSTVLLKRETPPTRTGRVLAVGVNTFVSTGPRIDGCSNTLSFKIPGKSESNQIDLSPAQVPVGGKVSFIGTGFSSGSTELLIKNMSWEKPYSVNTAWGLEFTAKGLSITVQETIPDNNTNPVDIIPGIYSAIIKVKKTVDIPGNPPREIEHLSNECPFMISPRIDQVTDNIIQLPATPDKTIILKGFSFPLEKSKEPMYPSLNVYVGNRKLIGIKSSQNLNAGEFKVVDMGTINLLIPDNLEPGITNFPLRIFINGAESPPNWIRI